MKSNKIKSVNVFIPKNKEIVENLNINYNKVIATIITSELSCSEIKLLIKNYETNKGIVE